MIISVVLLWVEKLNLGSISQFSMGSVGFKTIARRTSEAEILKTRPSITQNWNDMTRNWNDMFDLERNDGQGFRSFAVGIAAFKRARTRRLSSTERYRLTGRSSDLAGGECTPRELSRDLVHQFVR
jgi:hypothetical protein